MKTLKYITLKCKKFLNTNLNLSLDFPEDLKKLEKWEQNRNEDYEKLFPIN